jgi:hypothetical protein
MHLGLLSFVEDLIPTPMKTRARFSRKQTGESIPSGKLTCLLHVAELERERLVSRLTEDRSWPTA